MLFLSQRNSTMAERNQPPSMNFILFHYITFYYINHLNLRLDMTLAVAEVSEVFSLNYKPNQTTPPPKKKPPPSGLGEGLASHRVFNVGIKRTPWRRGRTGVRRLYAQSKVVTAHLFSELIGWSGLVCQSAVPSQP